MENLEASKDKSDKQTKATPPHKTDGGRKASGPKPPFSPYDIVIVGLDDHPGIAADTKADPEKGITAKDAEQRRKLYVQLFDERALLPVKPEFVASIRSWGVKEPITYIVFDGVAYAVNGRQRIKAARQVWDEQKQLGIEPEHMISIPGIKYDGDIDKLFATSRVLNIHIDEPPMMKARSMSRLMMEDIVDEPGEPPRKRTVNEVAAIYGCSDQHVRDMLALFKSSDTVKKALEELKQPTIGLLMTGLVKEDGSPDEEKQLKVLEELKTEQKGGAKVTVARAREKVQREKGKTVNSPKDKLDTIQRELMKLADKAQEVDCVACKDLAQHKAALAMLLKSVDFIARTAFAGGKIAFPTPIKDQPPGYTLTTLANTGD